MESLHTLWCEPNFEDANNAGTDRVDQSLEWITNRIVYNMDLVHSNAQCELGEKSKEVHRVIEMSIGLNMIIDYSIGSEHQKVVSNWKMLFIPGKLFHSGTSHRNKLLIVN